MSVRQSDSAVDEIHVIKNCPTDGKYAYLL